MSDCIWIEFVDVCREWMDRYIIENPILRSVNCHITKTSPIKNSPTKLNPLKPKMYSSSILLLLLTLLNSLATTSPLPELEKVGKPAAVDLSVSSLLSNLLPRSWPFSTSPKPASSSDVVRRIIARGEDGEEDDDQTQTQHLAINAQVLPSPNQGPETPEEQPAQPAQHPLPGKDPIAAFQDRLHEPGFEFSMARHSPDRRRRRRQTIAQTIDAEAVAMDAALGVSNPAPPATLDRASVEREASEWRPGQGMVFAKAGRVVRSEW